MVPRHRAHDVKASDCVFELFGRRTALRPAVKNSLPHFVRNRPGCAPFCQLAMYLAPSDYSSTAVSYYVDFVTICIEYRV